MIGDPEAIMNVFRTPCFILLTIVWAAGCCIPKHDPLVGWKPSWSEDPNKLDKAIRDDYQDYIQHLPPEERKFAGGINLYEDGSGRHAVKISMPHSGTGGNES